MLVAFEAGGLIRTLILFLLYPFICLVSEEMGFKIMVMVCFFGIKKDSFRLGSAVLPKFFLEDVGLEMFEVVQRGSRKVAVSNFPAVMVESFLRDYLQVDAVVGGRELRVFHGYFVGLMEERKKEYSTIMEEILAEKKLGSDIIGITSTSSFNKFPDDHQLFSHCKVICTLYIFMIFLNSLSLLVSCNYNVEAYVIETGVCINVNRKCIW